MTKTNDTVAMRPQKAAAERDYLVFSERISIAAGNGQINNSEPLVRQLNSAHRLAQGLSMVLKICNNNCVVEDNYDPDDPSSEPPLSNYSTSVLLGMAEEVCNLITNEICRTAEWTGKYGVQKSGQS